MDTYAYLAHLTEDGRTQTILEHLKGTASLCSAFAAAFDAEAQGQLAGMAHDIGKYSAAFQRRLHGGPKVDHASAGAFECLKAQQLAAAFAISGHHGGLPDGGGRGDAAGTGTFWGRINRASQRNLEDYHAWQSEFSLPHANTPAFAGTRLEGMFFTRMLFSCLVDADYTDTGAFMDNSPYLPASSSSMEELWRRLETYVSGWFPPKGALNMQRCVILEQCMSAGAQYGPGLFTLTVPTGGGKTVASLSFALAQAKARRMKRIVYVIPYTSIIEQTAQIFREILGDENVLEFHSGVQFDQQEDDASSPETAPLTRSVETWDVPVIVTTAVQFFESLYACRPSKCRKLHNLAQSVLIFDEAQMLPLPYLRPCVWAIAQLVRHYGASAVLCTATQPALDPIFQEFAPEIPIREICPMAEAHWESFRRVSFQQAGTLSWMDLAARLQQQEQVLCVVNTRRAAREVFHQLSGPGNFHLSTLMYPAHRRRILDEIRRRLRDGLPCRVVSTSLIEAGVDVDFPAVYRELSGLDSILQAAGRCNREGKRPPEDSIVTIFQGEDPPPRLFETSIGAGKIVLDHCQDVSSRAAIHTYFSTLLDLKGAEAQDAHHILPLMESEFFPFRTVAERFHLIESPTTTVYLPLEEGAGLVELLRSGQYSRTLYRRLGQYGVSVYPQHLAALEQAGALEHLEDGSVVLRDIGLYTQTTGLTLEPSGGNALFIG
ncbi:CRISPR-associated helicase Cas3' [Oscillibacter sp. KLE 1728]|jgi:CRISPR-associated helicase cas3|nr:CRISPR-associated helicase Cas3' [Oscillibacter sp. KLE 1728]